MVDEIGARRAAGRLADKQGRYDQVQADNRERVDRFQAVSLAVSPFVYIDIWQQHLVKTIFATDEAQLDFLIGYHEELGRFLDATFEDAVAKAQAAREAEAAEQRRIQLTRGVHQYRGPT